MKSELVIRLDVLSEEEATVELTSLAVQNEGEVVRVGMVVLQELFGHNDVLHRGKHVEKGTPQPSTPSAQTVGHGSPELIVVLLHLVVVAASEGLHRGGRGGNCVHVS